jgi:anti-anti-sigma regulatory factor
MVNVSYDHEHNTVIVEFKGNIDAAQAEQFFSDIEQVLPRHGKGFKLLTDFSSVEAMDLAVQRGIKKAMELFNGRGVTEVLRVLPDPDMGIGFNIMSRFRYSKDIRIHTLRSREEAEARLKIEETSSH